MSSKEYVFIKEKHLYNRKRYFVEDKLKITCLGGEKMSKEKPQLVFVDTAKIPKTMKGRTGRDWKVVFAQIPEKKSLIITKDMGTGATIRSAVKEVNRELGKAVYSATQRTVDKKTTVYVTRL